MKSYRKELWFNTPRRAFINITPHVEEALGERRDRLLSKQKMAGKAGATEPVSHIYLYFPTAHLFRVAGIPEYRQHILDTYKRKIKNIPYLFPIAWQHLLLFFSQL
jgi:hypothetical protein